MLHMIAAVTRFHQLICRPLSIAACACSVLENHHCALTFALLDQPQNALLTVLDKAQRKVCSGPQQPQPTLP